MSTPPSGLMFTDLPVIQMERSDIEFIDLPKIRMESPDVGSVEEYEVSYLMKLPTELLIGNEETLGPLVQLTYPDLMRLRNTSRKFRDIIDGDSDTSNYFWMLKTRRDWGATNRFPSKYFRNAEGKRRKAKRWRDEYLAYIQQQGKKQLKWGRRSEEERKEELLALLDLGVVPETRYKYKAITPLAWASEKGYADIVRALLTSGVKVDTRGKWKRTALMLAAEEGQFEIVNMLLAAGADVNLRDTYQDTALILSSKAGHTEIVERLLAAGAAVNALGSRGKTALNWAIISSMTSFTSPEIVDMLLAAGAEVDTRDISGNTALMALLQVHWALHSRNSRKGEAVERLLAAGANVNLIGRNGDTPLILASRGGYTDIVRMLLAAGAIVDSFEPRMSDEIPRRTSALVEASRGGYTVVVRMLLAAGANANSIDRYQNTPLMWAAWLRNTRIVRMLLEAGADIDLQNSLGTTALIAASRKGHPEIVRILLDGGANVSLRDNDGHTALEQAFINNHETIVEMLRGAESAPASLAALSRRSLREAGRGSEIPGFLQ